MMENKYGGQMSGVVGIGDMGTRSKRKPENLALVDAMVLTSMGA